MSYRVRFYYIHMTHYFELLVIGFQHCQFRFSF
ncbi:unnamed protein product [Spirodela intermedia]|uniref:Uncharacterized protein n=1 Tax=Spirodela intermedia TaxID=51605 RepID=A0A7I8K2D0_SPIIN|nr:unnamed protein product [Spirodela intermedia]